jgi:hypothetical protein
VGYASSSEPVVRFGLGPYERASEVLITWPGGGVQVLRDVKADRIVTVTQRLATFRLNIKGVGPLF